MATPTLSKREAAALEWLTARTWRNADWFRPNGVSRALLSRLFDRALCATLNGVWWASTDAGRAALAAHKEGNHA